MNKVVYLLGAGFSAPLGLPVMNNFLPKSKDMYFENPSRYEHFQKVFRTIKDMSVSKNYYETDLLNIEEILSILEMEDYLKGRRKLQQSFIQYISDVIQYYTPELPDLEPQSQRPTNWGDKLFGSGPLWRTYGYFVANLQNLTTFRKISKKSTIISFETEPAYYFSRETEPHTHYSVITLNYDLVLENICKFISNNYRNYNEEPTSALFLRTNEERGPNNYANIPYLAKLHGSVDSNNIIPPTWNKGTKKTISAAWKLAYKCLVDANHLRIIGYSLPTTDANVMYLLKSAVTQAPHLKSIDVLCLDPDRSVRKRYDAFITFKYYRFKTSSVIDYLDRVAMKHTSTHSNDGLQGEVSLLGLEEAHKEYFHS